MEVTVLAPAKINLFLEIFNKKKLISESELHELESLMQSVSLFDEISISCTKTLKFIDNELGKNNIIKVFSDCKNLKIKKRIPLKAGLAGGSADAAAVLMGLNYIFGNILGGEDLKKIASLLGSDVRFCLSGGTALVRGTGDQLKRLNDIKNFYLVIVKPDFDIITKIAYNNFDEKYKFHKYIRKEINDIMNAVELNSIDGIAKNLYNRFEEIVENKQLPYIKKVMIESGALSCIMSGSGSSDFGIFKDIFLAKKCKNLLKNAYKNVFLCEPINFGCKILSKKM